MISRKIWIPSHQSFHRFEELNTIQYKDIHKCIDNDEDFVLCLNEIIQNNSISPLSLKSLTTIDRFVIMLYLKIYSCGQFVKFTKKCEKCETVTKKEVDLNTLLDTLAPVVDRDFSSEFSCNSFSVTCNIPSIHYNDTLSFDRDNIDDQLDNYLFTYIESLLINKNIITLSTLKRDERNGIFKNIPYKTLLDIKNNFVDTIHKDFTDLLLFDMVCSNEECKETMFTLNLHMSNLTDIIKIIFNDDNLENILAIISDVSANCHFDYNFYKNTSPLEIDMIYSRVRQSSSGESSDTLPEMNKSDDLFEEYPLESHGMVESPSEFK